MHKINYKIRFWWFGIFLASCGYLIPLFIVDKDIIVRAAGKEGYILFFVAMAAGSLISIAGIIMELRRNMKPEQKVLATFSQRPNIGFEDGLDSPNFIDTATGTFCATFYLADGKVRNMHFRYKKNKKILLKYNNKKLEVYYKEVNGKYWLTKFDASQNFNDTTVTA